MRLTLAVALFAGIGLAGTITRAARAEDDHPIVALAKSKLKDAGKPFTLSIRVKVKEGMNAQFEEAFAAARKETLKEKGCRAYDLSRSADDASRYIIYERWDGVDALAAHLKAPHVTKLFATAHDCFDGQPEAQIYLPVAE